MLKFVNDVVVIGSVTYSYNVIASYLRAANF
jgi:hypothetical protein